MKTCPTCGQTLPPERNRWHYMFQGKSRRIVEIMQKIGAHGLPSDVLFERVYGGDPNGGPDGGPRAMSHLIVAINRKLAKVGKKICCPSRGPGAPHPYVMKDLKGGAQ